MRINFEKTIKIPEEVEVNLEGTKLIVKGKEGENKRNFKIKKISIKKQDNQIKIAMEKATKNEKKMLKEERLRDWEFLWQWSLPQSYVAIQA